MAKWLLVVETNSNDATREAEFNEWYDKIHLPDVGETPGFIKATRYENIEPSAGKAKFLALYEMEAEDIDHLRQALNDNMSQKRAEGRFSELLSIAGVGTYRHISSMPR